MCGIAALYRMRGSCVPDDRRTVERLLVSQKHRGPDDEGLRECRGAVLGHRRLSVIDLSAAARQPMSDADKVHLIFNGEIYNFKILREALQRSGRQFRSNSDTEVLLQGYLEWGIDDLASRLRGMFAFAILDERRQDAPALFHLVRDSFGIKPLYFGQINDQFILASEVRAFAATGLFPETSIVALAQFLSWGSVQAPWTTLRGVRTLPPGHRLTVAGTSLTMRRFAAEEREPFQGDYTEAVQHSRHLLEDAVERQLVSDVPLGLFLSGGIDSSVLAILASQRSKAPIRTVSIRFEEEAFDESVVAQSLAKNLQTAHTECTITSADWERALPSFWTAMDQPTIDAVNSYFVSKAARQAGLTVVLSGLGADELFLGYPHLRSGRKLQRFAQMMNTLPEMARIVAVGAATRAAQTLGRSGAEKLTWWQQPTDASVYRSCRGLFTIDDVQRLLGLASDDRRTIFCEPASAALSVGDDFVGALRQEEFRHYLPNQLLRDTDVMSMHHSLEVRVPFLDEDLVRFVTSLPPSMLLDSKRPKPLLLDALGDQVPENVWNRPKQGFTFPFAMWLKRDADRFESAACSGGPLDRAAVRDVWRRFKGGQLHWSRAWATVVASEFDRASTSSVPCGAEVVR